LYVIKSKTNHQGPNVLANELIGAELMRALNLPVPHWRFGVEPISLLAALQEGESGKLVELFFASQMAGRPRDRSGALSRLAPPFVIVNQSDLVGAFVFDFWAGSTDRRQGVLSTSNGTCSAVFIDNGNLFGGPDWSFRRHSGMFLAQDASVYANVQERPLIDAWVDRIQVTIPGLLGDVLADLPSQWFCGDVRQLNNKLLQRLVLLREEVHHHLDQLELATAVLRRAISLVGRSSIVHIPRLEGYETRR
jgi:hypothetical protein